MQQHIGRQSTQDEQRGAVTTEDHDLVIFGTGVGSSTLSWEMAKRGERVAVIERQYIRGSCPNIACLPSKNVIHSAKVASYFQNYEIPAGLDVAHNNAVGIYCVRFDAVFGSAPLRQE